MNKTQPLSDDILQPMLAAALYLASVIGPHAVTLNQQVRDADRQHGRRSPASSLRCREPLPPRSPGCWTDTGTTASHCPCSPAT